MYENKFIETRSHHAQLKSVCLLVLVVLLLLSFLAVLVLLLQGDGRDYDPDFSATGVACGAWHTLVLTSSAKVFSFGDGFTGQLGLEDRGNADDSRALTPRAVRIERNAGGGGGSPGDIRVTQVREKGLKKNRRAG